MLKYKYVWNSYSNNNPKCDILSPIVWIILFLRYTWNYHFVWFNTSVLGIPELLVGSNWIRLRWPVRLHHFLIFENFQRIFLSSVIFGFTLCLVVPTEDCKFRSSLSSKLLLYKMQRIQYLAWLIESLNQT